MKTQISTSVSEKTRQQADKLTGIYGTLRDVIGISIFSLYEKEFNTMSSDGSLMLAGLVEKALGRLNAEGVTGWGLDNPDLALFEMSEISEATGCTGQTCNHVSHDPAASTRKLIPCAGRLICLGSELEVDEREITYYALVLADTVKLLELHSPRHYWASLVEVDSVPDWALANLAK